MYVSSSIIDLYKRLNLLLIISPNIGFYLLNLLIPSRSIKIKTLPFSSRRYWKGTFLLYAYVLPRPSPISREQRREWRMGLHLIPIRHGRDVVGVFEQLGMVMTDLLNRYTQIAFETDRVRQMPAVHAVHRYIMANGHTKDQSRSFPCKTYSPNTAWSTTPVHSFSYC